jgi:hypothetical protein
LSPYGDDLLDERFKGIDKALESAEYHIRAFAPVAVQVGVLEVSLKEARDDLKELRADHKALRDERARERASNRAEVMKLVGIVVGSFIAAVGAVAAAVASGILG